ncbi:MAG: flagellar export chaperone FliS [bacterium]
MLDPVKTYKRAQTEGLSQRDLIVMCYKGAISFLEQAKRAHAAGEFEEFSELLEKAHRVIVHLYTTLDAERGGEIAAKLADLYAYMISQLYVVSATKEIKTVDSLIQLLGTVKEGWEQIDSHPTESDRLPNSVESTAGHKQLALQG